MDILVGTTNPGKVKEYATLLAGLPVRLLGLADVGLAQMDVVEDGATFEENAIIKARAYAVAAGLTALADDSGLCVDALGGAPGLHSARYGGPGLDDAGRRQKLLAALQDVPNAERGAYFICVIAVFDPATNTVLTAEGRCPGHIATAESRGSGGFGYDKLFVPQGYDRSFADFDKAEKNRISHRGRAADTLRPQLADWLVEQSE
ncbi:MAG: RdgB/HAM1 family non-canonical purine NTP pyrophosphatase [Chloroflexota bacterium]